MGTGKQWVTKRKRSQQYSSNFLKSLRSSTFPKDGRQDRRLVCRENIESPNICMQTVYFSTSKKPSSITNTFSAGQQLAARGTFERVINLLIRQLSSSQSPPRNAHHTRSFRKALSRKRSGMRKTAEYEPKKVTW